ncbi:MAG: hypothetical protein ABUS51_10105 [Acidobacteriota bacterium]
MRQIAIFAGVVGMCASAFAADTQLLNLVMPDAQVMAGVNVTTAKISPFGQYLLSQIGANDTGLQDFIAKTGFDPRQDVTEILAASSGNPATPGGLVLGKGNFHVDQLVAAFAAEKNQQTQTYAGATLITGTDAKATHAVAFIGTSIAVAGDVASVKAALDRASGVNSISPALAVRVQALSTTQDAWSVSLASVASLIPGAVVPPAGPATQTLQLVKNIQSSSGGVKFGANIEMTGQALADTPQNAAALADIVRMVAGLVSMSAAQNPQAAGAAQLLQNLKVSTDGNAVNLSASIPEAQVEALIQLASVPGPAGKARRL